MQTFVFWSIISLRIKYKIGGEIIIKKKILLIFCALLLIFSSNIGQVNAASVDDSNTIQATKYWRQVTRYYDRNYYHSEFDFPWQIEYYDGFSYGVLLVTKWYLSPTHYVVTYGGWVGPFAPLSVEYDY